MWPEVRVGELVDLGSAEIVTGPFGTQLKAAEYVEAGWPVINVRNVGFGEVRKDDLEFVDDLKAEALSRHRLQAGDIVFGRKGAVERHALIGPAEAGWVQGSDCIRLRIDPDRFRPTFASYALRTEWHQQWMKNLCSFGATMASLNQDIVRLIEIPDVPLTVQDLVIGHLSSFDHLIENNRRRIEILEEMARLLYREWFVHFRFPGHEDVELVDSELGPIPEGWEVARVEEIQANTRNATAAGPFGSKLGRKDYVEQGIPVIRGTNLAVGGGFEDSGFVYVSEQKAATLGSSIARPGDILVTQRGTLGQCGLISESAKHREYVISQSQMKLTCDAERVRPLIVYMQLALPEGVQRVLNMGTGSGVPHINLGMFREMKMLVPPRHVQDPYVEAAEPMLQLERNLRSQNEVLRRARDLLLPRLVSGELDVSALDLDGALA